MNLLITNTRNAQAYAIIRALRPHASKIVATMEGDSRITARLSHAANSFLVDKRYYAPSPSKDWRAGRIQKENTESEEAYVRALMRICEAEKIDSIFPSFDPHVYVLAKNKERFEKSGILIPVPDYETVIVPLDKFRTICVAQELGIPCPKTYLPKDENDFRRIGEEIGFPFVVKPRFTSAGWGLMLVRDVRELCKTAQRVAKSQSMPMIQEYIPGREKPNFNFLLTKSGDVKLAFCVRQFRHLFRVSLNIPTARESVTPEPCVIAAASLVQSLGYWGGTNVEMKTDARDGVAKLMEINPRLAYALWARVKLGINEPLICLKIARGEKIDEIGDYPRGVIFIDPIEDLLGASFRFMDLVVYKFRIGVQKKTPFDPFNPPMSLRELMQSYLRTYFSRQRKEFNPYFSYFFRDPVVSLLWWFQFAMLVMRSVKQLGR
jgi:biotin carboxylase